MRLIWKKYDSKFDPIIAMVGFAFLIGGGYVTALLGPATLRHPEVLVLTAVPLITMVIGTITVVREYQLWKAKHSSNG